MTNATLFNWHRSADNLPADPHRDAKLAYVAMMENYSGTPHQQKVRKTAEQLVSPAEHIQLALIILADEAAALNALLGAPVLLPAQKARAIQSAQMIETAARTADSFFSLVKPRCIHKEVYSRAKVTP